MLVIVCACGLFSYCPPLFVGSHLTMETDKFVPRRNRKTKVINRKDNHLKHNTTIIFKNVTSFLIARVLHLTRIYCSNAKNKKID